MKMISPLIQYLSDVLEQERPQWLLWVPVAIGSGIALYFALDKEPSLSILSCVLVILIAATWWFRHNSNLFVMLMALALMDLGMVAACWRTHYLATPMLNNPLPTQYLEGTIDKIEHMPNYQRLTLTRLVLADKKLPIAPHTARISFRGQMLGDSELQPGMRVQLKAALMPPTEAVAPQAYDFRRRSYFEGIGAVGYAVQRPEIIAITKPLVFLEQISDWLNQFRYLLTSELRARIGGLSGEIAAALITGDRSGIPDTVRQQYADAGVAHILAISGLHLSIVAGVVFFFVRGGLCLVPAISLRFPTKKWAAIGAMAFTFIYLLICAAPVSAQRSFLMTWLILAGVLTDRIALTLRNVALAATVILLMLPECLMSPSFQLSFAAVIALVAGYEALREPMRRWQSKNTSTVRRLGLYLVGISISTILATLATTPYIVYTFHRFTLHAIPANLLSIPLTSFMIMPGLVLMLVLMPFGLDGFLHKPLDYAIQSMTMTAQHISSWPGSVMLIPSISATSLGLLTFGALMLTFLKTRFRLWGLLPISIGIVLAVVATPPDLYISGDGKAIGLRTTDGRLWTPRLRGGKFARESWMKMMAASSIERLPIYGEISDSEIACNPPSYYLFDRYEILMGEKTVTVIDLDKKQPVIDGAFLRAHGGTLLWLRGDRPVMETVRTPNVQRPWSMEGGKE